MVRTKWMALLASGLLLAMGNADNGQTVCEGFVPPNDMKIPVGDTSHIGIMGNGGLTEAQYQEVMNRIQTIYTPVVQAKGKTLVVNRLWSDSTVNASAEQRGNNWIINMYGGIARHPDVTFEGQALVACHEMGHHLGGAPKVSGFGNAWASNEGGSDYFAALKCLRLVFASDNNTAIVAAATIDPLARTRCLAQYPAVADQDICMRISMAGESVAYLFQDLNKDRVRPQLSTPDLSEVSRTNDRHPATQCRMDTYFGGAVCPVAVNVPLSDTDFKSGSCVQGTDALGWRSRCWFKPDSGGGGGGGDGKCPFGDQSICDSLCQMNPNLPFCSN